MLLKKSSRYIVFIFLGCTSSKIKNKNPNISSADSKIIQTHNTTPLLKPIVENYGFDDHSYISLKPSEISTTTSLKDSLTLKKTDTEEDKNAIATNLPNNSPVANKIVQNYLNSEIKEPGGHCLAVSKGRFEKAYKEVHGHLPYEDLPDSMATNIYTPKQVFNLLYVTASKPDESWQSLPERYRGKGNAGAIAYAGMGTLVDSTEIWSGKLKPGALMQVWRYKEDYNEVTLGADVKKLDPYGHSFIFISYVRDDKGKIHGLKIADQGFQSYRPLVPRDYDVWWAVNLSI
ncbi:hypothetical protein QSV08_04970 [Maribacter sp. BPC-D8]|uniref:hypothetical protein n=1 Tax=Maribacter sp. BPC-D8 TaxID=3053613 RepID=UPI002B4A3EFE|nr:hypothetical protein [Maribacter sp. BPC-D8]WRI30594.1 hypothetical protein QSV08_04970 [Maribacter sp. BPC-D8]